MHAHKNGKTNAIVTPAWIVCLNLLHNNMTRIRQPYGDSTTRDTVLDIITHTYWRLRDRERFYTQYYQALALKNR